MDAIDHSSLKPGRTVLAGVPEGFDALVLARLAAAQPGGVLHVARDDARVAALAEALAFFAPDIEVIRLPAWDCLPYDRVSPNPAIAAERTEALCRLVASSPVVGKAVAIVLTTVNAALQRVAPRDALAQSRLRIAVGDTLKLERLSGFLVHNGYERVDTVREPGEYALRGGIVDLFPPGADAPTRIDLFGDEVDGLRRFDAATQRTVGAAESVELHPVSEAPLDADAVARFRAGYRELFGAVSDDPLYAAVSEGRRYGGMEHWLPLFHPRLETVFDYMPDAAVSFDDGAEAALVSRLELIGEYFDSRQSMLSARQRAGTDEAAPYRPLPPDRLYLSEAEWRSALLSRPVGLFSPFAAATGTMAGEGGEGAALVVDLGARRGYDFAARRGEAQRAAGDDADDPANVFVTVREHVANQQRAGRRTMIAAFTNGARERLGGLLRQNGLGNLASADSWADVQALPAATVALAVLGLEHGFSSDELVVIGEQDILGERLIRSARRRRSVRDVIAHAGELATGDLVVHLDHGVGRYEGLENVVVSGAPHDCLKLTYDGGDRLFVPVENMDVLSRYGSGDGDPVLDRLGGAAWQARKARVRQRLKDMADQLIKVAAVRAVRSAARIAVGGGDYEAFCARFPYAETDDQHGAIDDVLADLGSGTPMDRLVCGDVGFGKTEVAMRAAFAAVANGGQVAVVVPTTLLSRQHFASFSERFRHTGARIAQLSRLQTQKEAAAVKEGLADGRVDIVIGTHALLGKEVRFARLTLLVVDEEQHFGVAHKERLKQLRADVHVLTLTATPIPRTLQMALAGVRELSIIATPPVDRLAVRTFVTPFDPVVLREAIMREHFRGGQVYYVCPRIEDLDGQMVRLKELVPEVKVVMAHGRMAAKKLEEVIAAFYDGAFDVLLSTQIVEAGLDLPSANTLIVHRADRFGLAQLYQLRGRVGRSRLRAYAYFTVPAGDKITPAAKRRLEVLQSLDTLGAGFALASHDLDIRGAGNLLGEEQSGHIREVGAELYQRMLEEAVSAARDGSLSIEGDWSPQISLGVPVLIPETYVADLDVRLELYRRLAGLGNQQAIESFAAEMIDRFGSLPDEVETLLSLVAIKQLCRAAGIATLDGGPKGAVVSFHNNSFANPAGLVEFIRADMGRSKLRPDHRLVFRRDWNGARQRMKGARGLAAELAAIAGAGASP